MASDRMAPPVFFHRLAPPWVAHPENSDFISTPNSEHERRAARNILCVYFIFEKSWVAVKLYQGHLMSTKVSHSGLSLQSSSGNLVFTYSPLSRACDF